CACTRQDIARVLAASGQPRERHGELVYPGTCRSGLQGRPARAWRFGVQGYEQKMPLAKAGSGLSAINSIANQTSSESGSNAETVWHDRLLGRQAQNVSREVGDFVLKRADGLWAYQLAVVVDDAAQGITDIVRGEDLADNTARQILLQRALSLPTPRYLHTPLVLGANGEKLSKQNGAEALDMAQPLRLLAQAGKALGLEVEALAGAHSPAAWLQQAGPLWAVRFGRLKLAGD
ncbi:MAG: glutamate--tRNA ligase family protein, partial [Polaromonas sp.]|nr:glutamate--tRNA ligase family protein [Polaromonas sp.]